MTASHFSASQTAQSALGRLAELQMAETDARKRLFALFTWSPADLLLLEAWQTETITWLRQQAMLAGARNPALLATQLYCLLTQARAAEIQGQADALLHAEKAGHALLQAQSMANSSGLRVFYASAASTVLILAGLLLFPTAPDRPAPLGNIASHAPVPSMAADPTRLAQIYTSLEKMRNGSCHFPEALMLPEAHRAVYLRTVVHGEMAETPQDQLLAAQLMANVSCDYTPLLMKNSRG